MKSEVLGHNYDQCQQSDRQPVPRYANMRRKGSYRQGRKRNQRSVGIHALCIVHQITRIPKQGIRTNAVAVDSLQLEPGSAAHNESSEGGK